MTRYVCDKGHTFIHAAKISETLINQRIDLRDDFTVHSKDSLTGDLVEGEIYVCPFCHSLKYAEVAEADYVDWAQVPHSQVKEKLDMGWKVLSHTKDAVTMALCKGEKKQ